MIANTLTASLLALVAVSSVCARPSDYPSDEQINAVIPSPNQDLGDQPTSETQASSVLTPSMNSPVPIYVSPYVRSERGVREVPETSVDTSAASPKYSHEEPKPDAPAAAPVPQPEEEISYVPAKPSGRDLKSAASYGHGKHGSNHHEEGHHEGGHGGHGWLDMGAWTGGKGSFGWYADFPVGKKSGGHY